MHEQQPSRLSPFKWVLGVMGFIAVVIGAWALGMWMSRGNIAPHTEAPALTQGLAIALGIVGVFFLFLGGIGYTIVLACNCFTFNFHAPVFPSFRRKLWFANLAVSLLLSFGVAFMFATPVARVLQRFIPESLLFSIAPVIPLLFAQVLLIWFKMWTPLTPRLVRRRLLAMGFSPQQLASGTVIGISDPSKNTFKKLTTVEEDIGLLWFTPELITYRGDTHHFDIRREQFQQIQRRADPGAISSYFGAVHVILFYVDAAGAEFQVRLHVEEAWTMTATARALNQLAKRIEAWRTGPAVPDTSATAAPTASAPT